MNFRKCKICYKIYGEVSENPSKNVELQKEARERRRKLLDFYNGKLSSQLCGLQLQNISRRKKRLQFCTVCTETIQKIYNLDEKCKMQENNLLNFCNKVAIKLLNLRKRNGGVEYSCKSFGGVAIKAELEEVFCKICHGIWIHSPNSMPELINLSTFKEIVKICKVHLFPEMFDVGCLDLNFIVGLIISPFCLDCYQSLQEIRGMDENLENTKSEVKKLIGRFTMKVLRVRKYVNYLQTIPGLNGVVENDSSQSSTSGEEETSDNSDDDCVLVTEIIPPGSLMVAEISGLNPELENHNVKVQSQLNENEVNKKSVKETAPLATNTKDNVKSISGLTVESSAKTNVEVMQNNCSGGENSSNHVELVMISSGPIQETTSPHNIDIHESPEINGKEKKTHCMERLEDGSLCTHGESGVGDLNSSSRHLQGTFAPDSSDILKSPNSSYTEIEARTSTSAESHGCNSPDIQMTTENLSEENVGNNPIMRCNMEFLIDNNKEVICAGIKESTPGIQMNCEGFEMDLGLTPQPAINIKNMKELQENSSFGESDNDLIDSGEPLAVVETPTLNIQKCPKQNNAKMKESVKSGIEALQVTFAGEMIQESAADPYSQIISPDESQKDSTCRSGDLDCGEPISPEIEIDPTFYLPEEMLLDTCETVEIEYCEDADYMQNRDAEGEGLYMDCTESWNLTEDNVNNRDIEEGNELEVEGSGESKARKFESKALVTSKCESPKKNAEEAGTMNDTGKFPCMLCGEDFVHKSELHSHMRGRGTGKERTFRCSTCGKWFSSQCTLTVHEAKHSDGKAFECDKTVRASCQYRSHLRRHTGKKPFECQTCENSVKIKAPLRDHKLIHVKGRDKTFTCKTSGKNYRTKPNLKLHEKKHKEEPIRCPHCGKAICNKYYLKIHVRKHTGERPFRCNICGKSYAHQAALDKHQSVHVADKRFKCKTCDEGFSYRSRLKQHEVHCEK